MTPDHVLAAARVSETGARLHASTLAWSEKILISLGSTDNEERKVRLLTFREQARRGLRVMELLAAPWHRDHAKRQEGHDRAERVIRKRYKNLAARHNQR
jgi:hypothetical protein